MCSSDLTETTGLEPAQGHRVIELGCVELVNRRPTANRFHRYINPEREVDRGALEVHGIENEFLATQPRFAEVAKEFLEFVKGAELVIHNAEFDVQFLNHELKRLPGMPKDVRECCGVLDTLALARKLHPGQRNSLDALAKRYSVDNSKREFHGALLDAQILAEIYLAMTGGQASLSLDTGEQGAVVAAVADQRLDLRVQAQIDALLATGATVSTVEGEVVEASRDWWPLAMIWALDGEVAARAAAVVRPADAEQVAAGLRLCDAERIQIGRAHV